MMGVLRIHPYLTEVFKMRQSQFSEWEFACIPERRAGILL